MWLWNWIGGRGARSSLHSDDAEVPLAELQNRSFLGGQLEALCGRAVLVATDNQLAAALALIELDGTARRLVLCPPDLQTAHLPTVIAAAQADTCVRAVSQAPLDTPGIALNVFVESTATVAAPERLGSVETEWILVTSGTSGPPKLVVHTLASLTSAFCEPDGTVRPGDEAVGVAPGPVWSTFYDIRRYGGLQILLRALAGCAMVLSTPGRPLPEMLARAGAAGVTHISGTASHWRAVLMSGSAASISPRYVRLSGEIADQGILDALHAAYPAARIAHAFASTEAGVAFEVNDGRAGFPASWVGAAGTPGPLAQLQVQGGSLRLRSPGAAARYLGDHGAPLRDVEGFVDTGDKVDLRDGRYYFMGRSGGIINVGGLKVHPEEVEAVINAHPWVHMSLVRARRSPITGSVVTAEVVLADQEATTVSGGTQLRPPEAEIKAQLMQYCRQTLAAHKVPAFIQIVPALPLSAAGKLIRPSA